MKNKNKVHVYGAGLAGLTVADLLVKKGYEVTVFEKSSHLGGCLYTERTPEGIELHCHGAHIFHTNDDEVWNYVNGICK